MQDIKVSVIIPSRNISEWVFTQKTIDDVFHKAECPIEVIIVLDGYWPDPPLKYDKRLTILHHSVAKGMRQGINAATSIAKGKYIMKCDDHCMFGQGFDRILSEDCDDDWLAVPSRYSLNAEEWAIKKLKNGENYGPIDYLYLTYPFNLDDQFGFGFHGRKWHGEYGFTGGYFDIEKKKKQILIDDMMTFQGSCWFMPLALFKKIGGMQEEGYYQHQEAQELGFKVWLSGGRCVVNKKTWYAHLHKGKEYGRGYQLLKHQMISSQSYSCDTWMNNKWEGQTKQLKYLIDKFWPLEKWPEDWDNPDRWKNYNYDKWQMANAIQKKYNSDFIHADDLKGEMTK